MEDLEYCTEMDTSNSQAWVPLRIIAPKQQADVKSPAVIFLHPTGSSLHSEQAKMVGGLVCMGASRVIDQGSRAMARLA